MPSTQEKRPRASNGRFVKRSRAASKKAAEPIAGPTHGDVASDRTDVAPRGLSSRREGSVRLALLSIAILCAALGFALSFFWIAALVLMGVLWGVMLAERPQRPETVKGLVTEMVTAVVDEARDVRDGTPASDPSAVAEPSPAGDTRTTEA
jgi:hypothetical protein